MRKILRHRGLRIVFAANAISMIGSGMNAAAVFWHVLQATHSEVSLGKLLVLQTLPALLLLPFSGVIIDREDRRHLVMLLDVVRGCVTLAVAILALRGEVLLWHLYLMNTLVAAGFHLFWPTITALIQELAPDGEFVVSNTFLMAGVQGGWLIAGALVGFVYNHIGLGWILIIDFFTYVVSFLCYFAVRKGRHVVKPAVDEASGMEVPGSAWSRYWHELDEGILYLKSKTHLKLLGLSWALFVAAMLTQGAVTSPLSDRILHGGAVGYGWLNWGWGIGAFSSALYVPVVIKRLRPHRSAGMSLAVLSACLTLLPFSHFLAIAVMLYAVMGSSRGVGGTAITSEMMEIVPKHFMGRVQNAFYFISMVLQLILSIAVAAVAHRTSLALACAMIGGMYGVACLAAMWPVERRTRAVAETVVGN